MIFRLRAFFGRDDIGPREELYRYNNCSLSLSGPVITFLRTIEYGELHFDGDICLRASFP